MLGTLTCAAVLDIARVMEPGQSSSIDRRRYCATAVAKEEAAHPIREEQPAVQKARDGSPIQHDTGGAIVRFQKDRHTTNPAHTGPKRRSDYSAADSVDISSHGARAYRNQ